MRTRPVINECVKMKWCHLLSWQCIYIVRFAVLIAILANKRRQADNTCFTFSVLRASDLNESMWERLDRPSFWAYVIISPNLSNGLWLDIVMDKSVTKVVEPKYSSIEIRHHQNLHEPQTEI
jgi:hypothetical protein